MNQESPHPIKIPVGISSCLMGDKVRYDGGHKAHSYITRTLSEYFDFQPFCPELSIGLGVPRKPIRLVRQADSTIRCREADKPDQDHTQALSDCADAQRHWLEGVCGYILKKDSPSCGMERVKVWSDAMPTRDGTGVYAGQLMRNFPYLPMEEEGRLGDAVLRENFIQRVFALHRWRMMMKAGPTVAALVEFHARHKLNLMSHDQNANRELGRLVAATTKANLPKNLPLYLNDFMAAMKTRATRGNHVNTLQHIQGYLKNHLDSEDKKELAALIQRYRIAEVPLIVPITLLNHFFRRHPDDYIANSWYMNPYPAEMSLQNEI